MLVLEQGPVVAPTNRVPLSDYRRNLHMMVEMAQENIKVSFSSSPRNTRYDHGRLGDFREGYRDVMRDIAKHYGAPIADMPQYLKNGDDRENTSLTMCIPRCVGYRMIAQELDKVMFEPN